LITFDISYIGKKLMRSGEAGGGTEDPKSTKARDRTGRPEVHKNEGQDGQATPFIASLRSGGQAQRDMILFICWEKRFQQMKNAPLPAISFSRYSGISPPSATVPGILAVAQFRRANSDFS
jgi:hypothetical protein